MTLLSHCVLVLILNVAMVMDILSGKVRNVLILSGFVAGFVLRYSISGWTGLLGCTVGIGCSGLLLFGLFALGVLGAGDVKLFMVVGGFLGAEKSIFCIFSALCLGAVFSLFKMLRYRNFSKRMRFFWSYLKRIRQEGRICAYGQSFEEDQAVLHFSVSILFGVLLCLGGMY